MIDLPPGNIPKIDIFIDFVYTAKTPVNVQSNEIKIFSCQSTAKFKLHSSLDIGA